MSSEEVFKLEFNEDAEPEREEEEAVQEEEEVEEARPARRRLNLSGRPTIGMDRLPKAPTLGGSAGPSDLLGTPGSLLPGRDVSPPLYETAHSMPEAVRWRVYGDADGTPYGLGECDVNIGESSFVKRYFVAMPKPGELKRFRLRAIDVSGRELGTEISLPISGDHITLQELRKPQVPSMRIDPSTGAQVPMWGPQPQQDNGLRDIIDLAKTTVVSQEKALADERERARISQEKAAAEQINYAHTSLTTLQSAMERMAQQEAQRAQEAAAREAERNRQMIEIEQQRNLELRNTMSAQFQGATAQQQMFFQQQQLAAESRAKEAELHHQKLQREEEHRRTREQEDYRRRVEEEKRIADLRLTEERRISEARTQEEQRRWDAQRAMMRFEADARLAEVKAEAERRKEEEDRKEERRKSDEDRRERLFREEEARKEERRKEEIENRRLEFERKEKELERRAAAEEAERQRRHDLTIRELENKTKREEEHAKNMLALQLKTAEATAYKNGGGLKEMAVTALGFAREIGVDVPSLIEKLTDREPPPAPTDWGQLLAGMAPLMGALAPVLEKFAPVRQNQNPVIPAGYQMVPVTTVEEEEEEEDGDEIENSASVVPQPIVPAHQPQVAPIAQAGPQVVNLKNEPISEMATPAMGLPLRDQKNAREAIRALVQALRNSPQEEWHGHIRRIWAMETAVEYFIRNIGLRAALRDAQSVDENWNNQVLGAFQTWPDVPSNFKYE